jgi:LysM repeat protein
MRRFASRSAGLALSFVVISILVSGCFQGAGAALEPTATSNVPPTPIPTETPVLAPTVPPTEVPTVAPTQIPQGPPSETPAIAPTPPVAQIPTEAPTLEPTQPPPPTEFPTEIPTATPQPVAQVDTPTPPAGPFGGGPQATQTAEMATQFALATQILATATAGAALDQTATAAALGTFEPGGTVVGATPPPTLASGGTLPRVTGTPQGTPGAPGSGAAGAVTGDCVYTVAEGDRLFRIALRFGLTPAEITRANGIVNPDLIVPGQRLRIPNCNTTATPRPTPTFGTGGAATPTAVAGGGGGRVYIVQEGDTLFGIAMRFGVRVMAIASANGISNINLIYIGQRLVIP